MFARLRYLTVVQFIIQSAADVHTGVASRQSAFAQKPSQAAAPGLQNFLCLRFVP